MPRARLQVAWPPINMSAGNTMPRHTTPLSHPPSPSGPSSSSSSRRIYLSVPHGTHSFSPLFHPRRAFEYYGNVDARSPPRDSPNTPHLSYTLMSSRGLAEHLGLRSLPAATGEPWDPSVLVLFWVLLVTISFFPSREANSKYIYIFFFFCNIGIFED